MAGGAAADGGDSVDGVSVRTWMGPRTAPYPHFSLSLSSSHPLPSFLPLPKVHDPHLAGKPPPAAVPSP